MIINSEEETEHKENNQNHVNRIPGILKINYFKNVCKLAFSSFPRIFLWVVAHTIHKQSWIFNIFIFSLDHVGFALYVDFLCDLFSHNYENYLLRL